MFRRRRADRAPDAPATEPAATAAPPVVVVDDANFMTQTEGRVTVVDFWAAWCGPCRSFAPIFTAVASDHRDRATFGQCDVDANPRTAGLLQIRSVPTVIVFGPDGSELRRLTGVVSRRHLDAVLQEVGSGDLG